MAYRMIVTLLLCFMLLACAGTPQPSARDETPIVLPEGFLGTWDYGPAYDILYIIKPDGTIEDRSKETNELRRTLKYKTVYIEDPRSAYILLQNNNNLSKTPNYEYIHLINRLIYDRRKPERIEVIHSCFTDKTEWEKPVSELQKRILDHEKYDCDITSVWSSQLHYYRYEP